MLFYMVLWLTLRSPHFHFTTSVYLPKLPDTRLFPLYRITLPCPAFSCLPSVLLMLFLPETGVKKTSHLPLGALGKQKMSEFQTLQRGDSSALLRWPRASPSEDGGVPGLTKELVLQDLLQGLLLNSVLKFVFSFPFFFFFSYFEREVGGS